MPNRAQNGEKYPFKKPFLSKPDDNSLLKQWVVEYGVWSLKKQQIVRKRVVVTGETVAARMADANEIIKELNRLLRKGDVYIDPLDKKTAKPVHAEKKKPERLTLTQAATIYLDWKQKTTKKNTHRTYRTYIEIYLKKYLKRKGGLHKSLTSFTQVDALDFLDELILVEKVSNRTRNNTKDGVFTFFQHFVRRKLLKDNPFSDIGDLSAPKYKHTPFTFEQRDEMKEACQQFGEEDLMLFISFVYYTALRPNEEVRKLKIKYIRERTIYINADDAKDNEAEHVEIPPGLERLIQQHGLRNYPSHYYVFGREGKPGEIPVGATYFWRRHRKLLDRLKYEGRYDLYGWKHTGVIALWLATQNIRLIQRHCRHSSIQQTEEYLRDMGVIIKDTDIEKFPDF